MEHMEHRASEPTSRRVLFVFRGTATELLRLLAVQRHPAGKHLQAGRP